jgi:hypothetical protein
VLNGGSPRQQLTDGVNGFIYRKIASKSEQFGYSCDFLKYGIMMTKKISPVLTSSDAIALPI